MSVKKLSVVTVCLNVRDTIRLTLESTKNQTFPDVEHILIDGGSTDGTQDIIKEYDPGYFVSEPDGGVYQAMDKGAAAATGDIVIFLNAGDTFYDREVCRKVANFFDETRADIVFGNILPVYLDASDVHDHAAFVAGKLIDLGYMSNRSQIYDESIHHQATFYRRWVLEKCTYACPKPEATGEYNLLMKATFIHGARLKHFPGPISRFVLGGISTRDFSKEWQKYNTARQTLRDLYLPKGPPKIRNKYEFHHQGRPPRRGLVDRHTLKMRIKRSYAFKAYNRVATGMTARVSNRVVHEVDEFLQLRLRQSLPSIVDQSTAELRKAVTEISRALVESNRQIAELKQSVASLRQSVGTVQTKVDDAHTTISGVSDAVSKARTIYDHGYRVFSQWNEDGILQYLLQRVGIVSRTFIEIGVYDYSESNTRFLVQKDNWRGLIVDSDAEALDRFTNEGCRWKTNVDVLCSFVTAENVNDLIRNTGFAGEIDVFSLDIDGVDYWVWKALDVISPRIVICEYNALLGPDAAVTVPYDPHFERSKKHFSWTYAGASLRALSVLAREKGYTLVTCNSGGNNAFFVRNDLLAGSDLKPDPILFRPPSFRESRDEQGRLTFLTPPQSVDLLANMQVVDIETGLVVSIGNLKW